MIKAVINWFRKLFRPKLKTGSGTITLPPGTYSLRMVGGARSTKIAPLTELVWRAIMNKDPSIILPDCPKDQYANITILINSELSDKNTLHKVIMKLLK